MGLIDEEIKEIRGVIQQYKAGKISHEQLQGLMSAYGQVEKREKTIIQAMGMMIKYGKKYKDMVHKKNLIGESTAIDTAHGDIEDEKVFCPAKNQTITRAECLDFSGDEKNQEICHDCDIGLENKRLLIPNPAMFTA